MFGKLTDVGAKRDFVGAFTFYVANVVVLAGISAVLIHALGMVGMVEGVNGNIFEGGEVHTQIGSLFVLWLGATILTKRGLTSDMMSIIIVAAALYLAWTSSVFLGLVPLALLTTINK
jgi:hypothetical protein